ncbi:MAG: ubiquinone/menaquinone biosynthesis methyltransferase [SAR202 cluster bacterium]|nr:ubiquinone/menaquinone biosynthesis methyltransferase [SAR202 cluster bacterium]|tara:strand:+ start:2831 stop:3523 length:693 start_codon:yes stop_codon:yes gene_type:complete
MEKNTRSQNIQLMFNKIAKKYDLMNCIMSLGNHKKWEQEIVESIKLNANKTDKILDIACGTGSLTQEIIKNSSNDQVIGLDFSNAMLKIAKNTVSNLILGDSHYLPFKKNYFDHITIAYGIRNFENITQSLQEVNYVLNNKGTLNIIEIIKPYNNIKSFIFKLGFFIFAPLFGLIFSHNFSAYLYLPKSSNSFLTENKINSLLQKNGFNKITTKKKAFGSVILLNALKSN